MQHVRWPRQRHCSTILQKHRACVEQLGKARSTASIMLCHAVLQCCICLQGQWQPSNLDSSSLDNPERTGSTLQKLLPLLGCTAAD